jgi:hypothetical protein
LVLIGWQEEQPEQQLLQLQQQAEQQALLVQLIQQSAAAAALAAAAAAAAVDEHGMTGLQVAAAGPPSIMARPCAVDTLPVEDVVDVAALEADTVDIGSSSSSSSSSTAEQPGSNTESNLEQQQQQQEEGSSDAAAEPMQPHNAARALLSREFPHAKEALKPSSKVAAHLQAASTAAAAAAAAADAAADALAPSSMKVPRDSSSSSQGGVIKTRTRTRSKSSTTNTKPSGSQAAPASSSSSRDAAVAASREQLQRIFAQEAATRLPLVDTWMLPCSHPLQQQQQHRRQHNRLILQGLLLSDNCNASWALTAVALPPGGLQRHAMCYAVVALLVCLLQVVMLRRQAQRVAGSSAAALRMSVVGVW